MTIKVACYGVRENEVPFFNKLNKYDFELTLIEELLTHDNIDTAKGMDAVLLRGNCVADRKNIQEMHKYGVKYLFTRTVGYNHIDLQAAADFDMYVARVPSYSPNAIAELALTLAMSLLRHTAYTTAKTANKDFTVDGMMFSKEIRNCKVGIIGTGKIGLTEAKLFKGLGAEVLGYDVYQSEEAKQTVTFMELDDLLRESDIVSLHVPYFPGKNDKMVNEEFIAKMKDGAIFINTARGELQDNEAILKALRTRKLEGFGTDVFANEKDIFFQQFNDGKKLDPTVQALVDLYPRVLITPHIGSNTDEALTNMIETSFENLYDTITKGITSNVVELPDKSQAVS
ncbi:lactate dehydrogenase [Virgibacillus pantothenticus]|uniref:Lactate dehydrogenase n=1 Tax=Virgibacillus pantothenticus TaxID=1473 RepID=A0A0L0QU18_VIRPA|nr:MULTISPECIES: 2-hydroxyacid dehydrogenase [Virgibacillus]API90990.1 lactate dehydrogenase [Virgibacillus sp. 6R]KNE22051.1 lactate dehydrogenase [Virgibacillus pantothenticus]MBS7428973.1 lactate dehydrogenase [Virgibacillus sp. 19R1-5]MBU8566726.1 lactate dehydrogenase [Virgibacillus pantothenticus]MBU8600309.1 lactate dehydrogenase [Virgibacillus pantothenticus]